MTPDDYIAQRVDGQIAWYRGRGGRAQRKFKALRIIEMASAAIIPLVAGFLAVIPYGNVLVAVLGVVVAVSAGLIAIGHYQEIWIEYRTASESLKHQKYLFLTRSPPYDTDEAFALFVQCVEGLISKENSAWSQHMRPPAPAKVGPVQRGAGE
ncbi:MAG TPA: DUF4231 domain-containing protein [Luteimonas sp.]|nr:DUF4231 domain-containing protein [Luteimonas sp.]HRO26480.1 DUF4231 domain-containing protein [Luteimonas sp.]HRP71698.1 DUF4231 domain-containing protein [Luteimonas sp.]